MNNSHWWQKETNWKQQHKAIVDLFVFAIAANQALSNTQYFMYVRLSLNGFIYVTLFNDTTANGVVNFEIWNKAGCDAANDKIQSALSLFEKTLLDCGYKVTSRYPDTGTIATIVEAVINTSKYGVSLELFKNVLTAEQSGKTPRLTLRNDMDNNRARAANLVRAIHSFTTPATAKPARMSK